MREERGGQMREACALPSGKLMRTGGALLRKARQVCRCPFIC